MEEIASSRRCWFPLWEEASLDAVGRRRLDQLHNVVLRVARLGVAHNEAGLFNLECGVIVGGVLEDEPLVDLQSTAPSYECFKSKAPMHMIEWMVRRSGKSPRSAEHSAAI